MRRFYLFAYDCYYPSGGMNDLRDSYSSKKKAGEWVLSLKPGGRYDYTELHDTKTGKNYVWNKGAWREVE